MNYQKAIALLLNATELNQKSFELLPYPLFSPVSFCSELSGEIISTKPLKANACMAGCRRQSEPMLLLHAADLHNVED